MLRAGVAWAQHALAAVSSCMVPVAVPVAPKVLLAAGVPLAQRALATFCRRHAGRRCHRRLGYSHRHQWVH